MNGLTASLEGLQRAELQIADSAKRLSRLPAAFTNLLATTGGASLDSGGSAVPVDIVDISAETIALMLARTTAQANINALNTFEQVQRSVIELFN